MIWPFKKKMMWPPKRSDAWPRLVGGNRIIACWTHPVGKHRVFLVARQDGRFSKHSQFFSEDEFEMNWIQEDVGGSFYDSENNAVREINALFPWSKEVEPETHNAKQT